MRLIDADALTVDIKERIEAKYDHCEYEQVQGLEIALECIDGQPSAQPERKTGHYIGEADGYADGELVYDMWSCSECGCYFEDWDEEPTYNFCPNCGANMRGED